MKIGRLEFYATKRDKNGSFFGKIYPFDEGMRDSYEGGLVFFHESRIASASALRTDSRMRDYRYLTRMPYSSVYQNRNIYHDPVYVAFEAPRHPTTHRQAAATIVMLLEEADPHDLPDVLSFGESAVREALVTTFPSFFTLSRIGLDIVRTQPDDGGLDLLRTCWDASDDAGRLEFLGSLDYESLGQVMARIIEVDMREGDAPASPRRCRQAFSARADSALIADVSERLTPGMWVDGFLGLMSSPADRRRFLEGAKPPFRAHALARFVDSGGRLTDDEVGHVLADAREDGEAGYAECLSLMVARNPSLALRDGVGAVLEPDMWVDGFLEFMSLPEDRASFLASTKPSFRAHAIARFVETGGTLDEDAAESLVSAVRECDDARLATECRATVLSKVPSLALRDDVAGLLAPDMWVDGLLDHMRNLSTQDAFLASTGIEFRARAVRELIGAGMPLSERLFELCPMRSCPDLLDRVRWSSDEASYVGTIGRWLDEACLGEAEDRRLVVSVAERMHATGELLSPAMWAQVPAVVRIRLLVFWSNHYQDLDGYVVRGGVPSLCRAAYKTSWRGYDQTLKAAMLLFALPFSKNARQAFLDANDALVGEVVRQFNECDADSVQSFALGAEMQALLQRCSSRSHADSRSVQGFCDGREWALRDGTAAVWCHAGRDRPGGGRRKCDSLCTPINARDPDRGARMDPENQFLADLLANVNAAMGGGVNVGPWLDSGDVDLVEYAYRISGYVNKMAQALPHMVCGTCGARLELNYKYPRTTLYRDVPNRSLKLPALSATTCSCPNRSDGVAWHDADVYIHYCLSCHRIIDSRECRMRDGEGYYLCMYCGASRVHGPATACPSCGNTDLRTLRYYTGSMRKEQSSQYAVPRSGEVLIACKARGCMYDARDFRSAFEEPRCQEDDGYAVVRTETPGVPPGTGSPRHVAKHFRRYD